MTKLISVLVLAVLIIGGWMLVSRDSAEDAMMKDETAMEEDSMIKEDGAMMEQGVMEEEGSMTKEAGSYGAYSADKVAQAGDDKVLLYFHADWCPICRPLDADIAAHANTIPDGVQILKVDYDKETALKQKYGVTYQHTVVQVTADGTLVKKWAQTTPTLASLLTSVK